MCTTNIYTSIYPDNREVRTRQPNLCSSSRCGQPCSGNVIFEHPAEYIPYPSSGATAYTGGGHYPPTPTYSAGGSPTIPLYRSGDESDRSRRSSNASGSKRRSSAIYINGHRLQTSSPSQHDRVMFVDGPPTARTPPQVFTMPHTAPASPNTNYYSSSPRESYTRRPVTVDERPRPVHIEVIDNRKPSSSQSKRSSMASNSSRDSREGEADRQQRRREHEERKEEKKRQEETIRATKIRERIDRANNEIGNRPTVRPIPVLRKSVSSKREKVSVPRMSAEETLARSMENITLNESDREEKRARLRAIRLEREEEVAQMERLKERMMPRRRATVGPGSKRERINYENGMFRYE